MPRKHRPLIGLTGRNENNTPNLVLRRSYIDAVARAGGLPIVLPVLPADELHELTEFLDGLILTGGEDINPLMYDSLPDVRLGAVDTERDEFELALTRQWLASGKPLLGICRGIQVLQVAEGGGLIQDIPSQWPGAMRHGNNGPRSNPAHEVTVQAESLLSRLLETEGPVRVNSIHHQAIDQPAQGYRISAMTADGVIEAIEAADGRAVLGVQWHPEEMPCHSQRRLFANFVDLARRPSSNTTPRRALPQAIPVAVLPHG